MYPRQHRLFGKGAASTSSHRAGRKLGHVAFRSLLAAAARRFTLWTFELFYAGDSTELAITEAVHCYTKAMRATNAPPRSSVN